MSMNNDDIFRWYNSLYLGLSHILKTTQENIKNLGAEFTKESNHLTQLPNSI